MSGIRELLGGFGDAIGAGGMIGASAGDFCSEVFAEGNDAVIICGDDEVIEFGALTGAFENVLQKRLSEKRMKRLSGEAGGGPTGRDDTNDKSF